MRINAGRCLVLVTLYCGTIAAVGQLKGKQPDSAQDEHTIGSVNDKWEKVVSDGREIYVKTNGFYFSRVSNSGHAYQAADGKSNGWDTLTKRTVYGFHTYIVANLPQSYIVGAPQSIMHDIEGDCEARTYHLLGSLYFAGKNRSGAAMEPLPAENVERKLIPNSPLEKAFDMLCRAASTQVATPNK